MRHELRSEVHLPRVDGLDAVCVEHPWREHEPRHLDRGHPLHVPAQVAVDVAHACSHVAARQRIEVGLALRQDPPELLMAPLRAPLLLALHRVAEVEAQALDAVLAVLDPLDVAEFGPAVRYDEAEHLREPGPAHRLERVYGLDDAACRLAREQDVELESNPPEEECENALLVLAGPADDGVHLHRVVAIGLVEGAEVGPPPPLEILSRDRRRPWRLRPRAGLVPHCAREVELREVTRLRAAQVVVERPHPEGDGASVRGDDVRGGLALGQTVGDQRYRRLELGRVAVYAAPRVAPSSIREVLRPFRLVEPIGMPASASKPPRAGVAAERRPVEPRAGPRLELLAQRIAEEVLAPAAAHPAHPLAQPPGLASRRLRADVPGPDHQHPLRVVRPVAPHLVGDDLRRPAYRPRDPGDPVAPVQAALYLEPVVVGQGSPLAPPACFHGPSSRPVSASWEQGSKREAPWVGIRGIPSFMQDWR